MSKRGDKAFLSDIKEAIDRIEEYIKGIVYERFLENSEKQDAVVRNLEIIGEAVKNLSKDLRKRYKDVKCKEIAKMRDNNKRLQKESLRLPKGTGEDYFENPQR